MTLEEAITLVEQLLERGKLTKAQEAVFIGTWQGQTYAQIAAKADYDEGHIKDTGAELWRSLTHALGEKVTKHNLQGVLKRAAKLRLADTPSLSAAPLDSAQSRIDWGGAIDVSHFYGRTEELNTLNQWILQDGCRLVALLGMGGMGKTALSVKLTEQIQDQFQRVIWRSLESARQLDEILTDLLQFLSNQQAIDLPPSTEGKLALLLPLLQQQRCLVVLDNFEAVLESRTRTGSYRVAYEDYGELLKQVGKTVHRSCFVITSREKPREVANQEETHGTVRSLLLKGLKPTEGQVIFQDKGCAEADQTVWKLVVEHYAGNPLALKMAAAAVQELFAGNVQALIPYLEQGRLRFGDISDLLERQFERLTVPEQHIFYWLCVNREPTTLTELENDVVVEPIKQRILEVLSSLVRRCLVERTEQGWFLQPVVMEYVTEKFIAQVCLEILKQEPNFFRSHSLIKATAKDYVRQTQIRLILEPIVHHLADQFDSQDNLKSYLNQILAQLRQKTTLSPHYGAGNVLNLLCHLQADFTGYDFSHQTVWQAYLQNAHLPQVNFARANLGRSVFAGLFSTVLTVAFSPDGKLLATGDSRCEIQVWEIANSRHLMTLRGHQSWAWSIVFSPDAQFLVSGSDDYFIKIWSLRTGDCLETRKGPPNLLNAIHFTDRGIAIAGESFGEDEGSTPWHPETLEQLVEAHQGHTHLVRSLTYSPNGRTIALSTRHTFTIELLDIETGQRHHTLAGHSDFARLLKFSPDGTTLASVNNDAETTDSIPEIKIWDVRSGVCQLTLRGHTRLVNDLAYGSDGQWLATASTDQTLKLWNLQTGECIKTFHGHHNRVLCVAFAPDDRYLASGADDRAVKLWDIQTGRCIRTFQGYTNAIYSMAISPDRQVLATAHEDESVKLWNLETGSVFRTLYGHLNRVWCVAFPSSSEGSCSDRHSLSNSLLASSGADYTVRLWDWKTGQCLKTLGGHKNWVWSVVFNPNVQLLASGSYDRTIRLWDVQTGECLRTFQEQNTAILPVLFSLDGQHLFSGEYGGAVKQWDVETGACLQSWQAHEGRIFTIALHPTQPHLVSGGNDQTIKLWNLQTGQCQQIFQGHKAAVSAVRFTSDGQRLISASFDQTIRIWDVSTGDCIQTLQGHQSVVSSIICDTLLCSSSLDETIRLWDSEAGSCLRTLNTPRPYEGMNITGVLGLTEAEIATLKVLGAISHPR